MIEVGEMTVEDELREELRRARHDGDHVVQERDQAEREVQVLQERIRKALGILDELDEHGRVVSAGSPNYPSVTTVSSAILRGVLSGSDTATNTEERTLPEIEVSVMNAEEWKAACQQALDDIGFTYEQLAEMAAKRDFPSSEARKVWLAIGRRFAEDAADVLGENAFTLTREEWGKAAQARMDELGVTYTQLRQMALEKHFTSTAARKLWVLIGGTLDAEG